MATIAMLAYHVDSNYLLYQLVALASPILTRFAKLESFPKKELETTIFIQSFNQVDSLQELPQHFLKTY